MLYVIYQKIKYLYSGEDFFRDCKTLATLYSNSWRTVLDKFTTF